MKVAVVLLGFSILCLAVASNEGVFQRQFADTLTPALYGGAPNACSSSLGISMAFALVAGSAENANVFANISRNWTDIVAALETAYSGDCLVSTCSARDPLLLFANSVWLQENRTVDSTYEMSLVGEGTLQQIDFGDADAASVVNHWVNMSTNGLIDSILPDGSLGNVQFIAINALYFKAAWEEAFETGKTTVDTFFAADGERKTAFMHRVQILPWATVQVESAEYQVIQLPFLGTESLSMLLVTSTSSGAMVRQSDLVERVLPNLKDEAIALSLPKFTIQSKYDTKIFRQILGGEVFSEPLCVYEKVCPTIDEIIHEAIIEVNEAGVTAAAVTALIGKSFPVFPADPILVQFDQPFQFFLYESSTGLILMEGLVGDPMTTDELPNAMNTRSSTDFWNSMFGVDVRELPPPSHAPSMPPTVGTTAGIDGTGADTTVPQSTAAAQGVGLAGVYIFLNFFLLDQV